MDRSLTVTRRHAAAQIEGCKLAGLEGLSVNLGALQVSELELSQGHKIRHHPRQDDEGVPECDDDSLSFRRISAGSIFQQLLDGTSVEG